MESQDGISVRPMRLKVLYTFDNDSKTNCLARWPNLLEIQTAALDEKTQIGVVELKTCVQAIVSASPELTARLGQDYTVYAYDYSEYETPLVGQGMLSWVLSSFTPTPDAPTHQSQTMVTGRVCKNVLGLFSKGAQETLEVKLRLVPVPTVRQSEYLDSMKKYRELSNVIPHEFDAQAWTDFLRHNPDVMTPTSQSVVQASSPVDHAGIEKFHQILSAGSTPREVMSMPPQPPYRSTSPAQSALSTASRVQTPRDQFQQQEQPAPPRPTLPERSQSDVIRPSSSASMRDADFHAYKFNGRRDSIQSGYGSGDDAFDQQPRKRAKLFRAEAPGKSDLNIERQPSSLRVAASTAASVRIHRPTPINPLFAGAQNSNEEPVRPPTPISNLNMPPRRAPAAPSLLRESSTQNVNQYMSPYATSDDHPSVEPTTTSPEELRYQGLFESSFTMPSSPPVLDYGLANRSSPVLPPMTADPDSAFMSTGLDDLLDDELGLPLDSTGPAPKNFNRPNRNVRSAVQASSPASAVEIPDNRIETQTEPQAESSAKKPTADAPAQVIEIPDDQAENVPAARQSPLPTSQPPAKDGASVPEKQTETPIPSEGLLEQQQQQPVRAPAPRPSRPSSRPSSRASMRGPPKLLAPAPFSQSDIEQLIISNLPSEGDTAETPAPQITTEDGKLRSGASSRRLKQVKQVQNRLEKCIQQGLAPPYCENCGVIETPTWRRAHSKEIEGSEDEANEFAKDPMFLFWQTVKKDDDGNVTKFKIYKKTLAEEDNDFALVLLCNPCGLWLHKCKTMRPENKWNKNKDPVKRRRARNRRKGGPLSTDSDGGRNRSVSSKPDASSPGASDASSPAAEDEASPVPDNDASDKTAEDEQEKNDDTEEPPAKRRRANSVEPPKSQDPTWGRWEPDNALEALRRAMRSSPARNIASRSAAAPGERVIPPKPVRRALFPNSQNEGGPLKALGQSSLNSPKRNPRVSNSQESNKDSGDQENQAGDGLDGLFESPSFEFDTSSSPTPKRRNQRLTAADKRQLLPSVSPAAKSRKDAAPDTTPTRPSARRLQRVQSSPGSLSRASQTPGRSRLMADLPALSDDVFGTAAFQGMDDMFVDIFSEDVNSMIHTDPLFGMDSSKNQSDKWADWLPSDNSPSKSDGHKTNDDQDIINAFLSDPNLSKNMFDVPDPRTLDSGFFSSDAIQADAMAVDKPEMSADQTNNSEQV